MHLSISNVEALGVELASRCVRRVGSNDLATLSALVTLAEEADSEYSSSGEPLILKSFSPTYLFNLVHFLPTLPPQTLLAKLKTAISARNELVEMERSMCRDYFRELVTSGIFCAGGIDKNTGSIISWIDYGEFSRGCWSLRKGTPRANAWCRAFIFALEACHRMSHQTPGKRCIQYVDDSERRALDFNLGCMGQMFGLLERLFPCSNESVLVFGPSLVVSATLSMLKAVFDDRSGEIHFYSKKSDAFNSVEDTSDIPWFFCDTEGQGKIYSMEDRRCVWCYERLASEAEYSSLTAADVFNAGPWEYPDFDYSSMQAADETKGFHTPVIYEDDDGDDW